MGRVENVMKSRKTAWFNYIAILAILAVAIVVLAGYTTCSLQNREVVDRQIVEVKVPGLPGEDRPLIISDNLLGYYENVGIVTEIVAIPENPRLSMIRFVTSDKDGAHTQLLGGIVATGDVVVSDRVHCRGKEVYSHPYQARVFLRPCVKEIYGPTVTK